ncbi:hypothetical protein I4F81_003147 [Pyropia yezoensis]|uniref:Uncharacterized protein n=1 Tax=Pyropia yezoensis TaxID=2788 RepID=A0ACC3BS93_PYRYE|nr:hypothetical protein I4F81_003147 [Neopyropia yezoensis]
MRAAAAAAAAFLPPPSLPAGWPRSLAAVRGRPPCAAGTAPPAMGGGDPPPVPRGPSAAPAAPAPPIPAVGGPPAASAAASGAAAAAAPPPPRVPAPNLRDVSSALAAAPPGRLPPARLYRCGAPWAAIAASADGVLPRVATWVDLRTDAERVEEQAAVPPAYLPAVFLGATDDTPNGVAPPATRHAAAATAASAPTAAAGGTRRARGKGRPAPPPGTVVSPCGTRTWVHAPLLSHAGTAWALLSPLPLTTSVPLLARAAVGHPSGRAGVVALMDGAGLAGLAAMLVHHGGAGLAGALRTVAAAQLPVALFCTAGKDRTGLLAATVLAVCGASDEEIVADYAASEGVYVRGEGTGGGGVRDWYNGRLTAVGLGPDEWARAGAEVMVQTLGMMRERSGTVEAYLAECGFSREEQAALRAKLRGPL